MERQTNRCTRRKIGNDWRILSHLDHFKLDYFWHVIRGSDIEYDIMTGMAYRKIRRGKQKIRITDGIQQLRGMIIARVYTTAGDRATWRNMAPDRSVQ